MWLSFSHDLKQNLRLVTTEHQEPLTATLDALKGKLHLHVVDIIGQQVARSHLNVLTQPWPF